MDPHTKQDIMKFQEKIEKIDKDLDKQNKLMLSTSIEYVDLKEEFTMLQDKKTALEDTYSCLQTDI